LLLDVDKEKRSVCFYKYLKTNIYLSHASALTKIYTVVLKKISQFDVYSGSAYPDRICVSL